jgi:hypothetical protein
MRARGAHRVPARRRRGTVRWRRVVTMTVAAALPLTVVAAAAEPATRAPSKPAITTTPAPGGLFSMIKR